MDFYRKGTENIMHLILAKRTIKTTYWLGHCKEHHASRKFNRKEFLMGYSRAHSITATKKQTPDWAFRNSSEGHQFSSELSHQDSGFLLYDMESPWSGSCCYDLYQQNGCLTLCSPPPWDEGPGPRTPANATTENKWLHNCACFWTQQSLAYSPSGFLISAFCW